MKHYERVVLLSCHIFVNSAYDIQFLNVRQNTIIHRMLHSIHKHDLATISQRSAQQRVVYLPIHPVFPVVLFCARL